jgi:quercetin dioxygenase-like cupin family protein
MVTMSFEKDIAWADPPPGDFLTDVKEKVLRKDEDTGAEMLLLKIPGDGIHEAPHAHPDADQWTYILSGEFEMADGSRLSADGLFLFVPKGEKHSGTAKVTKETLGVMFWNGPRQRTIME